MFATTYDEAFSWPKRTTWGIKKWPKDRYIEPENKEQKSPLYRNSETLMQLTKECLTPFDYLLTPKPIVQTIPSQPFCLLVTIIFQIFEFITNWRKMQFKFERDSEIISQLYQ